MYQTAAPCRAGNGKAAGTNMNISADSYSSLYHPLHPISLSVSLSLSVSHLLLLSTSLHPLPHRLPPLHCLTEWTLIMKGVMEEETEKRPLRMDFWVAEKMDSECKSGRVLPQLGCLSNIPFPHPFYGTRGGLARGS